MAFSRSLKLGVARLKDLFLPKCPPSKGDHERLHRHLRETLSSTLAEVRRLSPTRLVGTSGTLINLGAMISEERDDRPLTGATGFRYDEDDLKDLHERLAEADPKELSEIKGLDPDRKDLVLRGRVSTSKCSGTARGGGPLRPRRRDGVILDYMGRNARKLEMGDGAERPGADGPPAPGAVRDDRSTRVRREALARLLFELPLQRDLHPRRPALGTRRSARHRLSYRVRGPHRHGWYLIKTPDAGVLARGRRHGGRGPTTGSATERKDRRCGTSAAQATRT